MNAAEFAHRFADEWIAAWNARDLTRALAHYEDDFEMTSPRIIEVVGEESGRLRGKSVVAAYWEKAMAGNPDLHFTKIAVFAAPSRLAIHYRNQHGRHILETFELGASGLVVRAAAHWEA